MFHGSAVLYVRTCGGVEYKSEPISLLLLLLLERCDAKLMPTATKSGATREEVLHFDPLLHLLLPLHLPFRHGGNIEDIFFHVKALFCFCFNKKK